MHKYDNRYPSNWSEISINLKEKAGWKCEKCGRICIRTGEKTPADWTKSQRHAHKLQVHHRDRDPENNCTSNLAILCSGCHLSYHTRRTGNITPGQLDFWDELFANNEILALS